MSNTKIIFLLIKIILTLCDDNTTNILTEVADEKKYIETFYKGCQRIANVTSKNCAIATLEWDFKCCLVRVGGNNESCKYLKDDNKWIKSYKKKLEEESGEKVTIKCENSFIKFSLFLIFIFLIF